MKNILTALVLGISLLVASGGIISAQDFQKGLEAAKTGDFTAARREWTPLAEKGDTNVQFNLGFLYYKSKGDNQDYKKALKWFSLAASKENSSAQVMLGNMYNRGHGVLQDYKAAAKWYTRAAENGDGLAHGKLGVIYAIGEGVLKDNVYAHMWLNIHASSGNKSSGEMRDMLATEMTASDISKAQALARECVKKEYKGC